MLSPQIPARGNFTWPRSCAAYFLRVRGSATNLWVLFLKPSGKDRAGSGREIGSCGVLDYILRCTGVATCPPFCLPTCNMDMGPDIAQQGMQFPMDVPPTLVKFDPPIFAGLEPSSEANNNRSNNSGNEQGGGGRGGGGKGNNGHQGKTSQLDDMVNSMLPPREWTEETGTWMQYVSKEPATRLAVITLQVHTLTHFSKREVEREHGGPVFCTAVVDCCWRKTHEKVPRIRNLRGPHGPFAACARTLLSHCTKVVVGFGGSALLRLIIL